MTGKHSIGITFLPQYPAETLVDFTHQAELAGFDVI